MLFSPYACLLIRISSWWYFFCFGLHFFGFVRMQIVLKITNIFLLSLHMDMICDVYRTWCGWWCKANPYMHLTFLSYCISYIWYIICIAEKPPTRYTWSVCVWGNRYGIKIPEMMWRRNYVQSHLIKNPRAIECGRFGGGSGVCCVTTLLGLLSIGWCYINEYLSLSLSFGLYLFLFHTHIFTYVWCVYQ